MLQAVLADFCALSGYAITVARDPRLPVLVAPAKTIIVREEPWAPWRRCIAVADAVLFIAPETQGVLARCNRMVEEAGKLLLGCTSTAVALAASKIETARTLARRDIAVPETTAWGHALPDNTHGYVIKPDDGAGSEDTYFFEQAGTLMAWQPPDAARAWIVQSYVPGRAMSLALLCNRRRTRVLAVNEQIIASDGASLRQSGTIVNAQPHLRQTMQTLADRIHNALPGLLGFIGVDYIETSKGPVVLEVNPRLTTSYVAMSKSLGVNVARLILDACLDEDEVMVRALSADAVSIEVH